MPLGTAIWVLGAHVLTLLAPIILLWSVMHYEQDLEQIMYAPQWLYGSVICMMIASAFEAADNSFDRWYLTGLPPSQCDFMFSVGICLSMAFTILACVGQIISVVVSGFVLVAVFAYLYLIDGPKEAPRTILGLGSTIALYWVTGDPIVFLAFVATFLTIYFFSILCATLCQAMHGFTTIVNAFGMLCIPWAFYNVSSGRSTSEMFVIAVATSIVGVAILVKPRLMRLKATPRKEPANSVIQHSTEISNSSR